MNIKSGTALDFNFSFGIQYSLIHTFRQSTNTNTNKIKQSKTSQRRLNIPTPALNKGPYIYQLSSRSPPFLQLRTHLYYPSLFASLRLVPFIEIPYISYQSNQTFSPFSFPPSSNLAH
ncbi:hypothetical protein QC760_007846 [Botrytis cinerea]